MTLSPFSIIVAVDTANGIAKEGDIPWTSKEDLRFFRDTTLGTRKKNAVIMGRLTYESIPEDVRPLTGRHCVVISRTWKQEEYQNISIYSSLGEALAGLGSSLNSYDEIFVAGGEMIYREALEDYMYLCQKIYVTKFKSDYSCDQFFPLDNIKHFPLASEPSKTRDYTRYVYLPKTSHDEYNYLQMLVRIRDTGDQRTDRTGTGTRSLFGEHMKFDIRDRLPVITTKKVNFDMIAKELLFFISGKTDTRVLEAQNVKIWKENTSKAYLSSHGLDKYEEGDMGPGYGFQWRHWGTDYTGMETDYTGKGIDQLANVIDGIRKDPFSRRHVLSAWNVNQLSEMALPPCHLLCQFYVSSDRQYLDCQLYQRSGDCFLGVPFNIASYATLTYMIAHITQLRPRTLIITLGDAHIYHNHADQVARQLRRTPHPFPKLSFRNPSKIHEIDDFTLSSFVLSGYASWPAILGDMAV